MFPLTRHFPIHTRGIPGHKLEDTMLPTYHERWESEKRKDIVVVRKTMPQKPVTTNNQPNLDIRWFRGYGGEKCRRTSPSSRPQTTNDAWTTVTNHRWRARVLSRATNRRRPGAGACRCIFFEDGRSVEVGREVAGRRVPAEGGHLSPPPLPLRLLFGVYP